MRAACCMRLSCHPLMLRAPATHVHAQTCCTRCTCCMHAGIIRRVAEDVLAGVAALRAGHKPGESTVVRAHALELYNEELRDLSSSSSVGGAGGGGGSAGGAAGGGGGGGGGKAAAAGGEAPEAAGGVRIVERPNGRDGRCTPEVRTRAVRAQRCMLPFSGSVSPSLPPSLRCTLSFSLSHLTRTTPSCMCPHHAHRARAGGGRAGGGGAGRRGPAGIFQRLL